MRSIELAVEGGWKVLYVGLVFGAGMPIVYALAMRLLTTGSTEVVGADGKSRTEYAVVGKVLAGILLLVIVACIALGITLIAASGFGKAVSFEHIFPTFVDKK